MSAQEKTWGAALLIAALLILSILGGRECPSVMIASTTVESQPATSTPQAEDRPIGSSNSRNVAQPGLDYWSMLFVFMLATFIGVGVIRRVSRLLHTPLMSLTNAISAIAVVGSIIVTGSDHPLYIRILGAIALFASMTNIVSGFLITDRMLKMFKGGGGHR
jgi:NAD(P) transhydrogenase subunit alpha